jgi:hypothetical protein
LEVLELAMVFNTGILHVMGETAIRGLDAELELYELLNLDAEGIEDLEFPQVDDILAE